VSVQAISWAFSVPGIDDTYEAFVLVALANYADDYGVAFPSVSTLASECRCSTRKVKYALAALEERGLIQGISRRRPNGSQRSSAFILTGFADRKIPARADEHPVLEQLYLEGRLPAETIRVHEVHSVDCQSARNIAPRSASKNDLLERGSSWPDAV
jgi:DNA-binding transcriptional MocR family regulator